MGTSLKWQWNYHPCASIIKSSWLLFFCAGVNKLIGLHCGARMLITPFGMC